MSSDLFRGIYFTHARGRIQSSGKNSHACSLAYAVFRGRNLTLADGWRALSGMIWPFLRGGGRMCPRFLGFCNRRADLFAQRFEANGFSDKRKGTPTRRPPFSLSKNQLSNSNMHKCGIHIHCNGIPGEGSPRKTSHRTFSHPACAYFE